MFKEYAKQVKANAKALADTLMSKGPLASKSSGLCCGLHWHNLAYMRFGE